MKVIGLTGGIASGKSLVADWFVEAGMPLIDADSVYKRLSAPGGSLYQEIIKLIPEECILDDGSIAWKKLGVIVFKDKDFRKRLNQVAHPAVIAEIQRELDGLRKDKHRFVIISVPLLFESGSEQISMLRSVSMSIIRLNSERLTLRDKIDSELPRLSPKMPP